MLIDQLRHADESLPSLPADADRQLTASVRAAHQSLEAARLRALELADARRDEISKEIHRELGEAERSAGNAKSVYTSPATEARDMEARGCNAGTSERVLPWP